MISHTLIDEDEPHCLYCKSRLNLSVESEYQYDVYIFTCTICNERFEIAMIGKINESNIYYSFLFSCLDLRVRFIYEDQMYDIGKAMEASFVKVQPFHVNFSNKKRLYKKIKTYLVFS